MFGLFSNSPYSPGNARQLRRIEQKLDLVLKHLGVDYAESSRLSPTVRALAEAGQKISAIKALREETQLGLAEAKAEVEAYLRGEA